MGHLPKMTIEIFKVTTVTTPENLLRLFDKGRSRIDGLRYNFIDFLFRTYVVRERKSFESSSFRRYRCIFGQCVSPIQP